MRASVAVGCVTLVIGRLVAPGLEATCRAAPAERAGASPETIVVMGATAAVAGLLAAYWLLVTTEGAYLGAGAVAWLYDRGAPTYDRVKRFVRHDDAAHFANPVTDRLEPGAGARACVLDVATGTGRAAAALLALPHFEGTVVGADLSSGMLAEAGRTLAMWSERCHLIRASAEPLPFEDGAFDAVLLLEALEFLPDRDRAIGEMARVLAPGGWLCLSNRKGLDRWLFPGKVDSPEGLAARLGRAGLQDVRRDSWQTCYDLFWARKPGCAGARGHGACDWRAALRCPRCGADGLWRWSVEGATCLSCGRAIVRRGAFWDLSSV